MDKPLFRALIWPGLILQKFTTHKPSDDQIEVALVALRQVLRLEKGLPSPVSQAKNPGDGSEKDFHSTFEEEEFEIGGLVELGTVQAELEDFPEK